MKMNVDIHTKVRKSLCLFTLLRWGRVKWSQLLFFGLFFALFGPVSSGISQAESLAEPQKLATLVSTALGVEHSLVLFFSLRRHCTAAAVGIQHLVASSLAQACAAA